MFRKIVKVIRHQIKVLARMFSGKQPRDAAEVLPSYGYIAGADGILSSQQSDISKWSGVREPRNTGKNAIFLALGTLSRLGLVLHQLHRFQEVRTTNVGVGIWASATREDVWGLSVATAEQPGFQRRSNGKKPVIYDAYHRLLPTMVGGAIDSLRAEGGNGNQPLHALDLLRTDPLVAESIEGHIAAGVEAFQDNQSLGAALVSLEGAGGTAPDHQYARLALADSVPINRNYRFHFLPCPEEVLNVQNARASLASILLDRVPDHCLHLFFQMDRTGPHPLDPAIMGGLVTITGTAAEHPEPDPVTLFNLMKAHGDWVVVKPSVVRVPMDSLGVRSWKEDRRFRALPESAAGGQQLQRILMEIDRLVNEAPEAYHIVTVIGMLRPYEIDRIKSHVRTLLDRSEQVTALVNVARNTSSRGLLDFPIVDFRVGKEVPGLVCRYLDGSRFEAHHAGGALREDLVHLAQQVSGVGEAQYIAESLRQIRDRRNR